MHEMFQCIEVQDVGSHYLLCEIFEFFVHWDKQVVKIIIAHFHFHFFLYIVSMYFAELALN